MERYGLYFWTQARADDIVCSDHGLWLLINGATEQRPRRA